MSQHARRAAIEPEPDMNMSDSQPHIIAMPQSSQPSQTAVPLIRRIAALLRLRSHDSNLKDELEEVIQKHEEDGEAPLSTGEKLMLRNMLAAGEIAVSDVMIPRADIIAVDYEITLTELKSVILEQRHTRMPVCQGTLDKLKGFIHLKDMVPALSGDEPFDMDKVLREVMFVSPAMRIIDLLMQMRLSGDHMAIVVDEYGGTDGLVTMEDLFEEIVGEIQDEHDTDDVAHEVRRTGALTFEALARIRIEELHRMLGREICTGIEDEDIDTLGGYVFFRLGRVPVRGEVVDIEPFGRLEILDADPRRIKRIRLRFREGVLAPHAPAVGG